MASINHHDLVDNYNILSIPCSLSILIKEELISEEDRQCNNCLNDIINKLEKEEIRLKNVQYINNIIRYQLCNITYNLQPSNFPLNQNIHNIYYSDVVVTHDKIQTIFNETIEQSHSDQWKKYRSIRISATKCHKIKTCRNLSEEGQTRIAEVISEDLNLFGKAAVNTAYGLNTENVAFEVYCEMFNAVTIKCGLIIHAKYPWLCASPDGLVLSKEGDIYKVLEIKCPISCKKKPIVDDETGVLNLSYLKYENGKIILKKSHQYYTQCQILMFVTGLSSCDLFIYNSIQPVLICIEKDDIFLRQILLKLECFYFKFFLPKHCSI